MYLVDDYGNAHGTRSLSKTKCPECGSHLENDGTCSNELWKQFDMYREIDLMLINIGFDPQQVSRC